MIPTKKATHITIIEDLAPGIKRIFNEVSLNRRFLNVESIWPIDVRLKYRCSNNKHSFEIKTMSPCSKLLEPFCVEC